MRIKITKVTTKDDQNTEIEFNSDFGQCRALWIGPKNAVDDIYEIEVEIPSILKWGRDILPSPDEKFEIKINTSNISFIGVLDSPEDGIFSLKLGNDVILIETEGIHFQEGIFVEVVTKNIIAYDVNI